MIYLCDRTRSFLPPIELCAAGLQQSNGEIRTERIMLYVVLTATAVLFLPPAAPAPAVCPTGWTSSPACFLVPPERSTSLFRCVNLCEEHGGTPAHRLGGGE